MKIQKFLGFLFATTMLLLVLSAHATLIVRTEIPVNSVAPKRAVVPDIIVTITNTGPETITFGWLGLGRQGTVPDDNFGGLMFLDSTTSTVLAQPKLLDLYHQGQFDYSQAFASGQSGRWLICAQMADDLSAYAGNTVSFMPQGCGYGYGDNLPVDIQFNVPNAQPGALLTANNNLEIGDFKIRNSVYLASGDQNIVVGTSILGGFGIAVSSVEDISYPYFDVDVFSSIGTLSNLSQIRLINWGSGQVIADQVEVTSAFETKNGKTGTLRFRNVRNSIAFGRGTTNQVAVMAYVSPAPAGSGQNLIRLQIDTTKLIAKGLIYGFMFFPSQQQIVVSSTMTVKEPTLGISISGYPGGNSFQNGIVGASVAQVTLDASQSSEDISLSGIPLELITFGVPVNLFTNCRFFDGTTAITGSIINPQVTGLGNQWEGWFTFGLGVTIPKGTVKTLDLQCDINYKQDYGFFTWVLGEVKLPAAGMTTGTYPKILWGNWWTDWAFIGSGKGR